MTQTSYFGQLFLELSKHIEENVPEIRWIDQDLGQLEEYEERPAVTFPCALIDFAAASYDELSELAQYGNVIVVIRLGVDPYSRGYTKAPELVREKAVAYYNLEQKLHQVVHGWKTAYTSPLIRVGAETERRTDKFRVRTLTYSTSYMDESSVPESTRVAADLVINTELL